MSALLDRLDRVEARREAILERVGSVPAGRLGQRPEDGGWSLLELVEHLVLAERAVLGDLERPPRPPRRRTLLHRAAYGLVMAILRLGIRVQTPSPRMDPTGERTLDELAHAWREGHRRLRAFVEGLDGRSAREAVFRHPVAGPLGPGEALRMLEAHLEHHESQLRRLLRT